MSRDQKSREILSTKHEEAAEDPYVSEEKLQDLESLADLGTWILNMRDDIHAGSVSKLDRDFFDEIKARLGARNHLTKFIAEKQRQLLDGTLSRADRLLFLAMMKRRQSAS